ncbi:hypothetical protein CANCADRAFT_3804 [Tortispora caseinolytica NRRL Y-17796]|uniref:Uncharacterized protein n=1 Tax=Tortispora caseinolytica NRRL Y-17796 TaxID=767744 RepID=A0A1E4TBN4_9ASCO|nr:hypothetical protein CANCADRAFT_3804 [Tortispora caseinolytica NRRL Y-17796]
MACPTVIFTKVVGTVTLGMMTGVYASRRWIDMGVLEVEGSKPAEEGRGLFRKMTRILGGVSSAAMLLAFLRGGIRGRHPYLLYSALVGPICIGIDWLETSSFTLWPTEAENEEVETEGEVSNLDGSVYRDLGAESTPPKAKSTVVNPAFITAGFATSLLGFIVATVGIHGDMA